MNKLGLNNCLVMSGNTIVAELINNKFEIVNESLLPLYFQRDKRIEKWLSSRAIDKNRANSRLLKKALRLKEKDDVSTVLTTMKCFRSCLLANSDKLSEWIWQSTREGTSALSRSISRMAQA